MSGENGCPELTAKECQRRIDQFVEVTNTDEALAQSILQDHDWNLESSINAYLGANQPQETAALGAQVTTRPPSTIAMITWNIDGLDEKNQARRIAFVIQEIKKIKPDIVFLQEVTDDTVEELQKYLVDYHCLEQGSNSGGFARYFTCILLRMTTVYVDEVKHVPFGNSQMGRGLQRVMAHVGKVKFCLMNVHLESTKEFGKQRVAQLEECLSKMECLKDEATVILAGDLNIRDSEVSSLRKGLGLPVNVSDVWELLGKRKEVQYTWDCMRNTNIQFPGRFKPRLRFDRVLIRDSNPKKVTPKSFNLIGLEKVPGTQSFASDHWGILTTYDINS